MIDPKLFLEPGLILHGHKCLGMPLGLRAGAAAMHALGVERSKEQQLLAIVEIGNDHRSHCFADGVQVISGCTFGKGNITGLGSDRFALTLVDLTTGRAVRVEPRAEAPDATEQACNLMEYRVSNVPPVQVPDDIVDPLIESVLNAPQETLLVVGEEFLYDAAKSTDTIGLLAR